MPDATSAPLADELAPHLAFRRQARKHRPHASCASPQRDQIPDANSTPVTVNNRSCTSLQLFVTTPRQALPSIISPTVNCQTSLLPWFSIESGGDHATSTNDIAPTHVRPAIWSRSAQVRLTGWFRGHHPTLLDCPGCSSRSRASLWPQGPSVLTPGAPAWRRRRRSHPNARASAGAVTPPYSASRRS